MVNFSFEAQIILSIGICLVSTFFLNVAAKKLQLPKMIAPLFIGLIINIGFISYLDFIPSFVNIISIFANFGIIIVLFFVGLGVDFRYMKDLSRNSSIMALNAGHVPFFLGCFATFLITKNWIESIFVGIALAITAEEVAISILDELNLLHKRIGQLIIEAGIIGDVFEIFAIAILGLFIRAQTMKFTVYSFLFELFLFLLITLLMRFYIIEWLLNLVGKKGSKFEYFTVSMVILLVMAGASEILNFSAIIGALLAGILLKDKLTDDMLYFEEHNITEALEIFDFSVFHPLIFIWIGLTINTQLLFSNIWFGIVLTVLAISGKLIGAVLGNYFCKESIKEGILIGWGLNARGATELFALLIARSQGIVSDNIFGAIVFMALITTIISPIVFKILVLNGYGLKANIEG